MATAGDFAQRSLKRILVQAADAPLEADDYADYLDALNDFMADLESDGVRLGYTPVTNIADIVTVPAGANRGIIANMAVEVSPDYGGTITQPLVMQAREGMKVLEKLGVQIIATALPTLLPVGSGSEDYRYTTHFFEDLSSALITLAGNSVSTVMTATDTAYRVAGFWNLSKLTGFRGDITGTLTNITDLKVDITATINFSATGNSTYTFRLMQNGVSVATVSSALTSTPVALALTKLVTLNPGDYLELWVEDDLATESVTVTQAVFEAL